MPLPSALAAKLSKRGIIPAKPTESNSSSTTTKKNNFKGFSSCPNKYNIYHECTYWCETHWKGFPNPDGKYLRGIQKLLFKFPLPKNWMEVFDNGIGRFYYWNMENDLVSWLPPKHPQSVKTQSAAKLREKLLIERKKRCENEASTPTIEVNASNVASEDKNEENRDFRSGRKRPSRPFRQSELLDPMDPAAYSDIPQGTWSDGLETSCKNAADSTATGALFQQRPYASPGEVLAANKERETRCIT